MAQKRVPKKVKKEIRDYVRILRDDNLPIHSVILFGSYAKGTPHQWSDIDLCIVSPKFGNPILAMQYLWKKRAKNSGLTVEPIGFSPKDFRDDSSLIHEIKKTGIKIRI